MLKKLYMLAALFISGSVLINAQNFTGSYLIETNDGAEIEVLVDNPYWKMSTDDFGYSEAIIYNRETGILNMVNHTDKIYREVEFDYTSGKETESEYEPEFTRGTETKEMLGYECVLYTESSERGTVEYWVADLNIPYWEVMGLIWIQDVNLLNNYIEKFPGFPVQMKMMSAEGELIMELTVTYIGEEEIEAAEFDIPDGYTLEKNPGQ